MYQDRFQQLPVPHHVNCAHLELFNLLVIKLPALIVKMDNLQHLVLLIVQAVPEVKLRVPEDYVCLAFHQTIQQVQVAALSVIRETFGHLLHVLHAHQALFLLQLSFHQILVQIVQQELHQQKAHCLAQAVLQVRYLLLGDCAQTVYLELHR